ncbi:hypothetical protein KR074_008061 [Drosophila pseudoananassae]|nr:hypothetical protein KR074_008061 [Drosophila pseudoananassae]
MKLLSLLVVLCCLLGVALANLKNRKNFSSISLNFYTFFCNYNFFFIKAICGEEFGSMGKCKSRVQKWTYRPQANECIQFYYTGCQGNKNNFDNKQACEQACKI